MESFTLSPNSRASYTKQVLLSLSFPVPVSGDMAARCWPSLSAILTWAQSLVDAVHDVDFRHVINALAGISELITSRLQPRVPAHTLVSQNV
jgi:hypothetical protein